MVVVGSIKDRFGMTSSRGVREQVLEDFDTNDLDGRTKGPALDPVERTSVCWMEESVTISF